MVKKLNIKKLYYLGPLSHKSLSGSTNKIISDCLEALIGAIYLDGGIKSAEKFILFFWKKNLKIHQFQLLMLKHNYKNLA